MNNNVFNELLERTNNSFLSQVRDRIEDGMTEEEAMLILKAYDLCDSLENTDSLKDYIPLMDTFAINKVIESLEKELSEGIKR